MTKFDQLKERYPNLIPIPELRANVSIIELAIHWGYKLKGKKGKMRPVLEHAAYDDTIIVKNPKNPAQQVYQRSGDFTDAGTIIDFVRNRLSTVFSVYNQPTGHPLTNITRVLYEYLKIDPEYVKVNQEAISKPFQEEDKRIFAIDQFDIRPLAEGNYLTQRCITPETIARPEFIGKIVTQISYFDPVARQAVDWSLAKANPMLDYIQFSNIAFPYYNGQSTRVTGLELRNKNVKLHATGSDRYSSVFVSNPPAQASRFYVLESVIDVLSHQQLRSMRGDTCFDSVYFSTGGQLTPEQTQTIFRYIATFDKSADFTIYLAFDNDIKGCLYDLQFVQQLTFRGFPMNPITASQGRVAYALPKQDIYQPLRTHFLSQVEAFNQDCQQKFRHNKSHLPSYDELNKQLILVSRLSMETQISIPETFVAVSFVALLLLDLLGLHKRIQVAKAKAKDFNEELVLDQV